MLPWGTIISSGLSLAELARGIYNSTKKEKDKRTGKELSINALHARIEELEQNQVQQAKISMKLAEQVNSLTRKLHIAYLVAIISILVSLAALTLIFVR